MPGRPAGVNGWAIASFVSGLASFLFIAIPLSVIFGIIALLQVKKTGQKGQGLAVAGLALSTVWTLVLVLVIVVVISASGSGAQSSGGAFSASGSIPPSALKVGNCLDNPTSSSNVLSVTLIPCAQAHNAQVFATFRLTGPNLDYPGEAAVKKLASDGCVARSSSLDQAELNNTMKLYFIYPNNSQWVFGQRSVMCLVVAPKPDLPTSLLKSGTPS